MITGTTECNAAAHHLGLVDTSASSLQYGHGAPYGCIYADNDWLNWYSPIGATDVSGTCGSRASDDCVYDCICTTQGMNT